MDNNYFFVDGSSLLADVKNARHVIDVPIKEHFDVIPFITYFIGPKFEEFHQGSYRRFVFYFVENDKRLRTELSLPDFSKPHLPGDIRVEFCGKQIRQYKKAQEWLDKNNAPDFVRECLYRSEKAVDTQICCDALHLAAVGKLDRLFLYTNDYDYVPLCQTLRHMGTNINLFRIRADRINAALAKEFDAIHIMSDDNLRTCFGVKKAESLPAASNPDAG